MCISFLYCLLSILSLLIDKIVVYECRILAENVLHKGLKVKLDNSIPGQNTRQLSVVGVNKINDVIQTVGWIPRKRIMYAMPIEEHTVRCEEAFVKYDFSKLVGKVSVALRCLRNVGCCIIRV